MDTVLASREWALWSTTCRLVVTDAALLEDAAELVDAELAEIEQACSRFRPDSELMTLVREEDGSAPLSPVLADLVGHALQAAEQTDGAVDPTIGSALVAMGYDRDIEVVRRDDAPPFSVVRRTAGWRSLHLDGERLSMPVGTQLDLGATAKAVAADRCARLVDGLGTGVLVSLGGDIATAGPAPAGGWQVQVQDLPDDVPQQVTLETGAAIATSGTAKRTWTQGGVTRHHLLDPTTGLPSHGPWRSVTVVADDCLRANMASTATLVKGETGLAWLRATGLPARLVGHDGRVLALGGWPEEVAA